MQLVGIKQLSEFLNVKEATIYSWVYKGTVPYHKLNGLLRFDMEEIEDWIKKRKLVSDRARSIYGRKPDSKDINAIVRKAIDGVKCR